MANERHGSLVSGRDTSAAPRRAASLAPAGETHPECCPYYHQAIELIGRRWTGAIVHILIQSDSLRFSEIAMSVPDLSDRLLSQRLKDLEHRGLIVRTVYAGPPVRVEYALTSMGQSLAPAVAELQSWALRWLR